MGGAAMSSPDVSGVSAYTVFAFTYVSGLSQNLSTDDRSSSTTVNIRGQ